MTAQMPPGWYDDPDGSPNAERRWDGHNWTPERRRKTPHTPPPAYPQPPQAQASYPQPPQFQASYPQPVPQPLYVQPVQQQAAYPQPLYAQPAQTPPYAPSGPAQPTVTGASNLFSIIAFVCAGLAVVSGLALTALPVGFGAAGLILGVFGLTKTERLAPFAIAAAVGGTILGWIIQAVVFSPGFY